MKILFRADSSSKIGLGHIMRDLVLAYSFKEATITFATLDLEGNINQKIKDAGYRVEILKSHDVDVLVSLIKRLDIEMVVIDHYGIDEVFERALKRKTAVKIFVLDDTYERHHCDILLNHNISADESRYKDLVPADCLLRCGKEFTLIRDEFKKESTIQREKIYDYFIAMGGVDSANLSEAIMIALPKRKSICIVTSAANKNLETLKKAVDKREEVTLFVDTDEVAKLLHQSHFAIVTPSVMVQEVLFMEVDFLAIKTAENQKDIYRYLLEHGYRVMARFDRALLDFFLHDESQVIVNFTELSFEQKALVLSWRNDETVAKWMLQKENISLDEHIQFIESLKQQEDRAYFLLFLEKEPIGVIDFTEITQSSAEIGLYAKPKKKGLGSIMMETIFAYARYVLDIEVLRAVVYSDNIKAIKLYERFGFEHTERKEGLDYMEVKI